MPKPSLARPEKGGGASRHCPQTKPATHLFHSEPPRWEAATGTWARPGSVASLTLSAGGPRFAQRTSPLGELTRGGLGKPLGRGEGVRSTNFSPCPVQNHNQVSPSGGVLPGCARTGVSH